MQIVKLKDVVMRVKDKIDKDNTDLEYYIGGEHIDSGEICITRKGKLEGSTIGPAFHMHFMPGDVLLMSRNPHLKKAGVVDFEGICSDVSYICRTKDESVLLQRYLPFIFQTNHFWQFVEENKKGGLPFFLNWSDFERYEFPLPNIEKQKELSDLLWSALDTKLSYIELLKQTDELVKSQFIEMFDKASKEVLLSDYVWFQEGPGVRSKDFTDNGVILLTGSNINDNQISFGYNSDRHISEELANGKYNHFLCDKDDILVVSSAIEPKRFDSKVVTVNVDKEYCLNTGIIRFKPNLKFLTRSYFKEFLKSEYFKQQVSVNLAGICQMHFGPSHLKKMTLLLPDSIELQNEFESIVKQSDKSKFEIKNAIRKIDDMLVSIMKEIYNN